MKSQKMFSITIVAVGLVMMLIWLTAGAETAVQAATLTVNSTADAADANPGNGSCATSGGVCTLRAAIQEANALAGDDVITLPAGTYTLSIAGTEEDNAATGDLDIKDNLTINGAAANTTIIDANTIDRVFHIFSKTTLQNVTIRNGEGYDPTIFSCGGGGIRHNAGLLTIKNSTITGNNTTQNGGGICNFSSNDITIISSTISGNSAGGGGGGVQIDLPSNLTISSSTITNNSAANGSGINFRANDSAKTLAVTTSQITNNDATNYGGGIYLTGGVLSISGGAVSGNSATSFGGGIYLSADGDSADMDNVTFANNSGQWGGALFVGSDNAQVNITNAVFDTNNATSGGGAIYYGYAANTTLSIEGATFSDNYLPVTASSGGAAVLLGGDAMTLNLLDSRLERNISPVYGGGGVSNYADNTTISIANSEFVSNEGYSGGALISTGDFVEVTIADSAFTGNMADGGSGGAVYYSTGQDSSISVTGSVFDSNTASANGGAFINVATTAAISRTTFTNNLSTNGGAIAASGILDMINSTLSDNWANESGGGLYSDAMSSSIGINNVTIAYNIADYDNNGSGNGGGFALANGASLSVGNSMIATNQDKGSESPDCDNSGVQVSQGYNLVGNADGCNWTTGTADVLGTAVSPVNPLLQALSGTPGTHGLGVGSPAIDAGSPGPVSGLPPNCEPEDQNGTARPIDGDNDGTAVCDIGAVEAPKRVAEIVNPGSPATLTFTDTQNNQTIISFPAGAVAETTTFVFSSETAVTTPATFSFAGHAFTLNAYQNDTLVPGFVFAKPVTITIYYSDNDAAGLGESTLVLLYWDGATWSDEGITFVSRDTVNNSVTVTIDHLSQFALFGQNFQIYLPNVMRSN